MATFIVGFIKIVVSLYCVKYTLKKGDLPMKKVLAVLLTAVMLITAIHIAAFAANNGPADVEWAFISVYYAGEGEPDDKAYDHVYSEKKAFNNAVPGVTYDKATNTLTLDNYKNKKAAISANMMGDDFKINVVGECEIAMLAAWGDGWGGSVTITGTGMLTINEEKLADSAIVFRAEHTASKLTVDSGVTVKLFGDGGVYYSSMNLIDNADKAVTAVSGQELFDIDVAPFFYQNSQYMEVYVITDSEADGYKGEAAVKADDPDTYYGVSIWTSSLGEKSYHVSRYIYSEEYGMYFSDPVFLAEYGNEMGQVEFTKDEFDSLGFSMTVTGKELSSIFFFDANDAHSGPQLINSADPNGIYMLDHNGYSYTDQNDASTYTFKGTIYKLLQGEYGFEADTSFTPIVIGTTDYEQLPAGFTAVMDEEYEKLYLTGEYETVNGNLYENSDGNQYVIYNHWTDGEAHHYVYAIEEASDVPGAYIATLVEDIDDVDNSEYTLVTVPEETDTFEISTKTTEFTFEVNLNEGWNTFADGHKEYVKDGVKYKNKLAEIDGKTYYFDSDGKMVTSKLVTVDGKKYYFGKDGVMYTKRLISVSGKKYYMGADGAAYTKKLISVSGKKYYMGADGAAYTNKLISVSGKKYYMGSDGAAYMSKLASISGKKYYFGKDGVAYISKLASVDGKKYYFGKDGVAYTSKLASVSGKKYYFGKDGVAYKSKLISVSGKKYYIGKDCVAYKSKFASLSGKKYYFGSDCAMYKSKTFSVSGVKWKADSNGVCKKV